jgi:alpha-glucoside transport system substrate-binding protein
MGMADVSRSGWPGTDWIEDIVLHQSGPTAYDQWVAGNLPWSSLQIKRAWKTFGQIATAASAVAGNTESELATGYGQAGGPMFTSPPGCYLDHEGSFITGFYPQDKFSRSGRGVRPAPVKDFNFIQFPPLTPAGKNVEEVSADLLAMFNATPAAGALIRYLTTPQAQEAWISRAGSGALSVNRQVRPSAYPDKISGDLAQILTSATTSIHFDASNSMPQTMENAFDNAVLQYLDCPAQLKVILYGLDLVRENSLPASQRTAAAPAPAPASSCVTRSKPARHRHKRSPR